jgi:hypothetical protein
MNADDAEAFDELMALRNSPDESQNKVVRLALKNVIDTRNSGMYFSRGFPTALTEEQLIAALNTADASTRQAALDTLGKSPNPRLLPKALEMIQSDSSLDVRCAAHRVFNTITKQKFQNLDKDSVLRWWAGNKQNFAINP